MTAARGTVTWILWLVLAAPALADEAAWVEPPAAAAEVERAAARHASYPRQEPWGAEDRRAEAYRVQIPEPMVFDLVRGLGARRGEVEINTLAQIPYRSGEAQDLHWAPEIEYAIADGIALEFELPFEGSRLEAIKLAAQVTFGTRLPRRCIHGAQLLVERPTEECAWEATLLYVPGVQWNRTFSALGMLGLRHTAGGDVEDGTELILNLSVFADVGPETSLGLESNYAKSLARAGESLLVMPQIHQELTDHFMLQAGAGARFERGGVHPELAARLIYTF